MTISKQFANSRLITFGVIHLGCDEGVVQKDSFLVRSPRGWDDLYFMILTKWIVSNSKMFHKKVVLPILLTFESVFNQLFQQKHPSMKHENNDLVRN